MKTTTDLRMRPFDVHIPNLDGDGIAETIRIEVPVRVDAESGEEILTPDAHELIEKTKARRMGLMLPDEIRELRERFKLTQEQISELLQIGAKTYTRWESGRARPSRSLNLLLCALRDGALSLEYLRCKREGRDWAPLLRRRIRKSIVFVSSGKGKSHLVKNIATVLDQSAVDWRRTIASEHRVLDVADRAAEHRAKRGQITHFKSPYTDWTPPEAV